MSNRFGDTKDIVQLKKNENGEYIKISRVIQSNSNSIDIRTMYTADDNEIKLTKKGVRFNSELCAEILYNLFKSMNVEEMEEFFSMIDIEDIRKTSTELFGSEESECIADMVQEKMNI